MWLLVALCFFLTQGADKKQATQKLGKKETSWNYDFSLKHVSKGWGDTCLHGERQSPINLPAADKLNEWKNSIPKIDWNKGRRVKIVGKDTGRTLKYTCENGDLGKVTLGKEDYALKHIELHMGSEHTIDDQRSALEIQFVHEHPTAEHNKLIISILCDESDDENMPTMNVFMNRLAGIPDGRQKDARAGDEFGKPMELDLHTATIGQFEKKKVDKLFYRYIGSETTPPCKEKVKWIVLGAQVRLKNKQIFDWLKKKESLQNNFRPVQDNNGRVLYIGPTMDKENEYEWPSKDGATKEKKEEEKKPVNNEIKKTKEDEEPKKKSKDKSENQDENADDTKGSEDNKDEGKSESSSEEEKNPEDKNDKEDAKQDSSKDESTKSEDSKKKSEDASKDSEGESKDSGKSDDTKSKDSGKSDGSKADDSSKDAGKTEDSKDSGKSEDSKDSGKSGDSGKSDDSKDGKADGDKGDSTKSDESTKPDGKESTSEDKKDGASKDEKSSDGKSNSGSSTSGDSSSKDSKKDEAKESTKDESKDSKEDKSTSKDGEKKADGADSKSKDKKPANAAASVHHPKINAHLVKTVLGAGFGVAILITLVCIFRKRDKVYNVYERLDYEREEV